MLSLIISAAIGVAGIAVKVWLALRPNAQQRVADTSHAMLQDAVDKPSGTDVIGDLHDGKF